MRLSSLFLMLLANNQQPATDSNNEIDWIL